MNSCALLYGIALMQTPGLIKIDRGDCIATENGMNLEEKKTMTTQYIKLHGGIRWANYLLLFVFALSVAAQAQIVVTISPEVKARLREQAKRNGRNPAATTERVNWRETLEARTSRGKLNASSFRATESRPRMLDSDAVAALDSSAEAHASSIVYGPHQRPFGVRYKDMIAQWWQWASGIPQATNPADDKTGAFAFAGQRGDFWFLAGNGGGVDERAIQLPAHTPLFIPALTLMYFDDGTTGPVSEEEIRTMMKEYMDTATTLEISVDHQVLPRRAIYRTQSDRFTIAIPDRSIYGPDVPKGIYDICFADTYFTMLKPLAPGSHVIKIKGATPDFTSYVEYYIFVVPPSDALRESAVEKLQNQPTEN